jgi:hypothetical protein
MLFNVVFGLRQFLADALVGGAVEVELDGVGAAILHRRSHSL